MSANEARGFTASKTDQPAPGQGSVIRKPGGIRDIPGCIKYILLLFLLILLAGEIGAGEFRGFPDVYWLTWLILLIKILLIIGLIILIWVQRQLICEITAPKDCAHDEFDSTGLPFLKVMGSVGGAVFGHYLIEVYDNTLTMVPGGVVSYPGGGSSGTSTVTNNELGRIDTRNFDPGMYTVKLRVFSTSGAEKNPPCQSGFNYQRATVFISAVAGIDVTDAGAYVGDPDNHRIKLIKTAASGADEQSEGSSITVSGGAYLHGCGNRTFQYLLQYMPAPLSGQPPLPSDAGPWTDIVPPLSYDYSLDPVTGHPYWWDCFFEHSPNFVMSDFLTRVWSVATCLFSTRPRTRKSYWFTGSAVLPDYPAGLNGRFTVRVVERDAPDGTTSPVHELLDAATVWIDNRQIVSKIRRLKVSGGDPLDVCQELSLSQFQPTGNADILGQAWDPLILDGVHPKPNDNFGSYSLTLKKNSGPGTPPPPAEWQPIHDSISPVPPVRQVAAPPPAPTDILATWNIVSALDSGPLPLGSPPDTPAPYPQLYRGQRCAYIIRLVTSDTTIVGDGGGVHSLEDVFPFCIVNDLK